MKQSLSQQLEALSPPTGNFLRGETLERVFYGVGRLTHLTYPAQRLEEIKADLEVTGKCRYIPALRLAHSNLHTESWRERGAQELLFLLIEPLTAIHETLKEEEEYDNH